MGRCLSGMFFVSTLCVAGSPALAAQKWDCMFTRLLGAAEGLPGEARVEIDSDAFNWEVLSPGPTLKPIADPVWTKFEYRVLENNDTGVVAVSSEAQVNRDVGPLVGATIITISKPSGDLRMGSVMTKGVHDLLTGHCDAN